MLNYRVTITLANGNMYIHFIAAKTWKAAVLDAMKAIPRSKQWRVKGMEFVIVDILP